MDQQTPVTVGQNSEDERLDALIRAEYERCRPDDTFEDLKRRAGFSKEDRCLLRDWRAVAKRLDREMQGDFVPEPLAAAA